MVGKVEEKATPKEETLSAKEPKHCRSACGAKKHQPGVSRGR